LREIVDSDVFDAVRGDRDSFAGVSKVLQFEGDYDPCVYRRSGREVLDALQFALGSDIQIAIAVRANQV
jgi:hypothetical protein